MERIFKISASVKPFLSVGSVQLGTNGGAASVDHNRAFEIHGSLSGKIFRLDNYPLTLNITFW